MSQLKNITTSYNIAGGNSTFSTVVEIGKEGRALIQAVHSFTDATAKLVPLLSVDNSNFTELYKFGDRIEKTLGGTGSDGLSLSDLPAGALLKCEFEVGSVTTGTLTINVLT